MSWLSKAKKRAGRWAKKQGKKLVVDAITGVVPGGNIVSKALSVAKSLGKKRRGVEAPRKMLPAVKVANIEQLGPRVPGTLTIAMPGGSPLPRRSATARARLRAKKAASAATGRRRGPPKGGLNLKAMAASWRKAGKPGTWRDWIRSNPER